MMRLGTLGHWKVAFIEQWTSRQASGSSGALSEAMQGMASLETGLFR